MAELGVEEPGLDRVIRAGYRLLGLADLLHGGPERGARLDRACGRDRARGGRARSTRISSAASSAPRPWPTPISSPAAASPGPREAGKLRLEGKDYVVKDGDVMHFRFNV
jgi:ribosome-binding ATPase